MNFYLHQSMHHLFLLIWLKMKNTDLVQMKYTETAIQSIIMIKYQVMCFHVIVHSLV